MVSIYRLMHRLTPRKYICLLQATDIMDCYHLRDKIAIPWTDLTIWNPDDYANAVDMGFVAYEFGEGIYGH